MKSMVKVVLAILVCSVAPVLSSLNALAEESPRVQCNPFATFWTPSDSVYNYPEHSRAIKECEQKLEDLVKKLQDRGVRVFDAYCDGTKGENFIRDVNKYVVNATIEIWRDQIDAALPVLPCHK